MYIVLEKSDLRFQSAYLPLELVGLKDFEISLREREVASKIVYRDHGGYEKVLKDRNGSIYGHERPVPEKLKLNSRYDLLKRNV
jgi:hypothetical protein